MVHVMSNGSNHGAVLVSPKTSLAIDEMGDYELDDHIVKDGYSDEYNHKQDVPGVKTTNHEPVKIIRAAAQNSAGKKLRSPVKETSRSAINGTIDSNSSGLVLTPAEIEKQTSHADHPEINGSGLKFSPQNDGPPSLKTTEKSELSSSSVPAKQRPSQYKKYYDEEDTWSLASSTAISVRTMKSKVTVPVAPKFTSTNRLEKRKEYYTKLEEKHKALEKEKLEYQARTKEEEAAAIKLLRKSMMYKANPVPSFYCEGPPPKPELKKLPVTRAKSPNLTRRKSCGDAAKVPAEDKGFHGRAARHSVGSHKEGRNSLAGSKVKDRVAPCKSNEINKVKVRPKELIETSERPKVEEQRVATNAV